MKAIQVVPLNRNNKKRLLDFMSTDRTAHFYAVYDILHLPERTQAWIALSDNNVIGYLIDFDKRILYMRGNAAAAGPLLGKPVLTTALFNIEPEHLSAVRTMFTVSAPADKITVGKVTSLTPMMVTMKSFRPVVKHQVQPLSKGDAEVLAGLLGTDIQTAKDLLRGIAFGVFEGGKLVSYAASPEILEDLAIVRGVFTSPEYRNRGLSKSVCSFLAERLLSEGRDVFLYVSKNNAAAISVYSGIGFQPTGHVFLSFWAQRKIGRKR